MTIHMLKLCVGVENLDHMIEWQARQMRTLPYPMHHTRMRPKRAEEMLNGGSIYWVVRRAIRFRQRIIDITKTTDKDGRALCALHFDPEIIQTYAQPKRPFQGWRYLKPEEAPRDLKSGDRAASIPADLDEALKQALVW